LNYQKTLIILLFIISVLSLLISGCTFVTPDYDSYTISYIKVTPTSATMEINTSKFFKLWAYDSEDNSVPIDSSKVTWTASYECWACGTVWTINPKNGSITTYFTPKKAGRYRIYGHYKGRVDSSIIDAE